MKFPVSFYQPKCPSSFAVVMEIGKRVIRPTNRRIEHGFRFCYLVHDNGVDIFFCRRLETRMPRERQQDNLELRQLKRDSWIPSRFAEKLFNQVENHDCERNRHQVSFLLSKKELLTILFLATTKTKCTTRCLQLVSFEESTATSRLVICWTTEEAAELRTEIVLHTS